MGSRNNNFDNGEKIVLPQYFGENAFNKMSFLSAKMGSYISNLTENLTSLENIKDLPSQIHKSVSRNASPHPDMASIIEHPVDAEPEKLKPSE